jgi:hypothetical protein
MIDIPAVYVCDNVKKIYIYSSVSTLIFSRYVSLTSICTCAALSNESEIDI